MRHLQIIPKEPFGTLRIHEYDSFLFRRIKARVQLETKASKTLGGDWITILDADDWYAPNRLATLIGKAQEMDVEVIVDNVFSVPFDARNVTSDGTYEKPNNETVMLDRLLPIERPYITDAAGMLDATSLRNESLHICKPVIQTQALLQSGVQYRIDLRFAEDFVFLFELLASEQSIGILP